MGADVGLSSCLYIWDFSSGFTSYGVLTKRALMEVPDSVPACTCLLLGLVLMLWELQMEIIAIVLALAYVAFVIVIAFRVGHRVKY